MVWQQSTSWRCLYNLQVRQLDQLDSKSLIDKSMGFFLINDGVVIAELQHQLGSWCLQPIVLRQPALTVKSKCYGVFADFNQGLILLAPANRFIYTSWMAVLITTDRPMSVRNHLNFCWYSDILS